MEKQFHKLLIGLFALYLTAGLLFSFLPPYVSYSEMEGKPLYVLKASVFTTGNLFSGALFHNIEVMVEDHFPQKNLLIEAYAKSQQLIGKRYIKNKALGKEGYLAMIHSGLIDSKETDHLLRLKDRATNFGASFYYAVAPTKDHIMANWFPNYLIYKGEDPFEKLHDVLDGNLSFIDLSIGIKAAETVEHQYFKTDHHWNQNGFFTAYTDIANTLYEDGQIQERAYTKADYSWTTYPDVFLGSEGRAVTLAVAEEMEDFVGYAPRFPSEVTVYNLEGDQLPLINENLISSAIYNNDYSAYLSGTNQYAKIINHLGADKPKALIAGISFAPPVVGLLADHFSEITYVDLRKYKETSFYDLIEREQPDVVLVLYYSGFYLEDMYQFDSVNDTIEE